MVLGVRLELAELDREPVVDRDGAGVHFELPGPHRLRGVVGGVREEAFGRGTDDCLGDGERDVGVG